MNKTGTPITIENLKAAGFYEYKDQLADEIRVTSMQKKYWDEAGEHRKYFIQVKVSDLSRLQPAWKKFGFSYEADSQFNTPKGETFNVVLLNDRNRTIEEMEAFFEKMFTAMGCVNYDERY